MPPNIPCFNFDSTKIFQTIRELERLIGKRNWIEQWFMPYYENLRCSRPSNFETITVEFLGQLTHLTKEFIDRLPKANEYFWATFFWICGVTTVEELDKIMCSNIIESIITYSPTLNSGWVQTVRWYVFYCSQKCGHLTQWNELSNFMVWRQFASEHSIKCKQNGKDVVIYDEKFLFITNSDDTKNFLKEVPEHSYDCFARIPNVYVVKPHQMVLKVENGFVYSRMVKCIGKWSLFRGYLTIRICPSENRNLIDCGTLLRHIKYEHMYVSLYNAWAEQCGTFPTLYDVSPNIKISNSKSSVLCDEINDSDMIPESVNDRSVLEWMLLHDNVPFCKFISFRVFSRAYVSRNNPLCLSPFFTEFQENENKGGVLVSNDCQQAVQEMISMCDSKNRVELRGDKANTMIIVQDSTARNVWDKSILKYCKVRGEIRKLCHVTSDTTVFQILSSRFVIVQASTFRSSNLFSLMHSVSWYRIIVDGCITIGSNTAQRILQLNCDRRWCITFPGETRVVDVFGITDLWRTVEKPIYENSRELELLKKLFTVNLIKKTRPVCIHYVDISPNTLKRVNSFCHKISVANCYKAKYVNPILEVLSSGEDVYESKLWDIMYTDKIWPQYKYLPVATETSIENASGQCIVCFSTTHATVQLQCRHLLCIRCTQLLRDCPICRSEIEHIYQPNGNINSHLSNSTHSDNIFCNEKNVRMISVLEELLQEPHRRIIVVFNGSSLLKLQDHLVTNDVKVFETQTQFRVLLISSRYIKNIHFSTATDLLIGFPPNTEDRKCSCSPGLKIHVFLFKATIEQFLYEQPMNSSAKHKKFWEDFRRFIELQDGCLYLQ